MTSSTSRPQASQHVASRLRNPGKRTHVDDDVERVIVGQKDTDTAAVLHGFVVVEVQFVHLRVAGTEQFCPLLGLRASTSAGTGTDTGFSCSPVQTHLWAQRAEQNSRDRA